MVELVGIEKPGTLKTRKLLIRCRSHNGQNACNATIRAHRRPATTVPPQPSVAPIGTRAEPAKTADNSARRTWRRRSVAQVAPPWLRHQTVPVIPIIGARKISQLQDNLASLDLVLSAEQLKNLDGASQIEPGFPQSVYEKEMPRTVRYGGMWDRLVL
jgi:diketogulonate reductase-like aldo/keto reductase